MTGSDNASRNDMNDSETECTVPAELQHDKDPASLSSFTN